MRVLLPLAAGAAILAVPASATSISSGKELVNACYEAASVQRADTNAISKCSLALRREATTAGEMRVATLVNRGILLMLSNNSTQAVRDFDEALSLNPNQSEAWLGKAVESWKAEDDQDALRFAERAIDLHTDKPELAYLVRGLAKEGLGNVTGAYADLLVARKLAPAWAQPSEHLKRYRVVRR